MYEKHVRGELAGVSWRDGSSGRFTGDIEGLYEGYRWEGLEEQRGVIEVAHGTIAFVLKLNSTQEGSPRAENPFAGGNDPLAGIELARDEAPLRGESPGSPDDAPTLDLAMRSPRRQLRATEVLLNIDGESSSGIYKDASGEMAITAPNFKDAGYLQVTTPEGNLRLNFLQWREGLNLVADLWVDGENSTGIYKNARGDLHFYLIIYPEPPVAIGPYSGTIWLEQNPSD